jgi:hypothetical protein
MYFPLLLIAYSILPQVGIFQSTGPFIVLRSAVIKRPGKNTRERNVNKKA